MVNPAGLAITYGYDAASQRITMNQPTGLFTYIYDPDGRISDADQSRKPGVQLSRTTRQAV